MPTDLGQPYSPLWRGRYPHMLKEDYSVWERFLNQSMDLFKEVYYDVKIGGVYPGPEYGPENMRKMFYDNTAKRIDAIGVLESELWIIEVATRPGLRAVGQLQTYLALWWQDPKLSKPTKGVLVCQAIDDDLAASLSFYGMLVRYAI